MYYHSISIGYVELPNYTTLNIYVVGCKFKCVGCQNPELQNYNNPDRQVLRTAVLSDSISNSFGMINAICWLGGEPFDQFDECARISRELKKDLTNNIPIVVYTGHKIDEYQYEQINCFDLIIDGQWNGYPIADKDTNQRIWKNNNNNKFEQISYNNFLNLKFNNKEN